jgi:hypothetical protein
VAAFTERREEKDETVLTSTETATSSEMAASGVVFVRFVVFVPFVEFVFFVPSTQPLVPLQMRRRKYSTSRRPRPERQRKWSGFPPPVLMHLAEIGPSILL